MTCTGTSSGVSDCSIEPPPSVGAGPLNEGANFAFSPEEGFEGYGEVSSDEELVIEDKVDLLVIILIQWIGYYYVALFIDLFWFAGFLVELPN